MKKHLFKIKIFFTCLILSTVFVYNGNSQDSIDEQNINELDNQYVDESIFLENPNLSQQVLYFDISGIRLRMKPRDVEKTALEKGYALYDTVWSTPEFFKYNYDSMCRKSGEFEPKKIQKCIDRISQKEETFYISKMVFKHTKTKESLDVYFTSNVLKNSSYKIEYQNDLNELLGDNKKFKYQRAENRRSFWYEVNKKYGPATGDTENTWIYDLENPGIATLTAGYDGILLESENMKNQDFVENLKLARQKFKSEEFTF